MEPGLGLPGAGVGGGSVAAAAAAGLGIRTNTPHNAAGAQKIPIAPRGSISGSLGGPNRATKPTPTPLDFRIPANTIKKEPQQQANTLPPARISRSDSLTKDLRKRKPSRPQVLSSEEEEESEEEKEEEEAAEEEEEEEREVVEEQEEEMEEEGEQEEEGEDYQEEEDGDDGPKPYDACDICKEEHSEEGNAIVICDNEKCQKGFHQKCYVPEITQEVIDSQPKWYCRQCEAEKSARRQARAIKRKQGTETTDSDDEPLLPVAKRMKRDSESSGTDGRNGEDPRQKSKAQLDRELRAQRRLAQKDAYHREYKARKLAGEEARRSLTAQELNFPPVEEDTSVDIGNENDTA